MEDSYKKTMNVGALVFVACLILLKIYYLYFPFRFFEYLVPPGDDPVSHYLMIKTVLAGKVNFAYPPLFHIIIAGLSKLFGENPMTIMRIVTPALIVLPSIAVLIITSKLFGRVAGLFSFIIVLWASNYGLVAFGDGNYPNIIAGGFFLPLAVLYFIKSLQEKKARNYIFMAAFVLLIVLTHHLSTAMYIMIIFAIFSLLIVWNRYEKIMPKVWKTFIIFVGIVSVIASFLYLLPTKTVFISAIHSFNETGNVLSVSSFSKLTEFSEYNGQSGELAWYFGLFSLLYTLSLLLRKTEKRSGEKIAMIALVAWFLVIFLVSRTERIGLPGRFMRESYLPLAVLSGLALKDLLITIPGISRKAVLCGVFGLIVIMNLTQVNGGAYGPPEYFKNMIWFTSDDNEKTEYIKQSTTPGSAILANQTTPYFPIFAERMIVFADPKKMTDLLSFKQYVKASKVSYIFIGNKTGANPDGKPYPFFAPYEESTKLLKQYASESKGGRKPMLKEMRRFIDGTVLYSVAGN